MTRDELMEDIRQGVCEAIPANKDLDGDDLDTVVQTVTNVTNDACEAIDADRDEAEDEEEGATEGK